MFSIFHIPPRYYYCRKIVRHTLFNYSLYVAVLDEVRNKSKSYCMFELTTIHYHWAYHK